MFADQRYEFGRTGQSRIREQRVERSGGLEQFGRGLFSDAGNARQIVGWIAFEAAIVGKLRGVEIETGAHRGRIVAHHSAGS